MKNYNETWENMVNSFTVILDNISKYQDYYNKKFGIKFNVATLQHYCFYIIDFYEFGIMYDIDKVIFQDDDEQLFNDKLLNLYEAMFELSKTLNLINTDNGEIELKSIFNKFEKYVYALSLGMDDEELKEVFKEIWGLFSLIHERLNPNNDDQNAQIMARKYKQIIEEYDYKEAVEEYKKLHYSDEILSFDKVGYYFNYLYCIMVKFEKWLKDILPFYKIDFNDIVVSKIDDNRQNDDDEQPPQLPQKLNTPEAMKYFNLAVKKGYMKICDNKYCWIDTGRGTIAKLAYFLSFVYLPTRPYNDLEEYFGVKKLSSAVAQAEYKPKRNDVKTWRNKMKTDLNLNNTLNDRQNG